MSDSQRIELSGRLFALEAIVARLLTEELQRSSSPKLLLEQTEADIRRESVRLPPAAIEEALQTLARMRKSSLPRSVYLKKADGLS
jgi:hypothetical protein